MGALGGKSELNENRGELGVGAVTLMLGTSHTSPGNAVPGAFAGACPGVCGVRGVRGEVGVRGAPWDCVRICPCPLEEMEAW